jgi:L-2,4-diaminobutyrate decarboxylase
MFDAHFFGAHPTSQAAYQGVMAQAIQTLLAHLPAQAYRGDDPAQLAQQLTGEICPPQGLAWETVATQLGQIVAASIGVWNPRTAAHLHTPVVIPALAAEVILTALNQSMDSFDQAPMATVLEEKMLAWLCQDLIGFGAESGGTFTAGGTQSNYMGLLLALHHTLAEAWGWSAMQRGLPPDAKRIRFLCSEAAHFSVEKSAMQLGLGTEAVIKIGVDAGFRLDPQALTQTLADLKAHKLVPAAIVATASNTDFGAIDPLLAIREVADQFGVWLHVDAAYGGALLLSPRHRDDLAGIHLADSVTVDFHKAFFQPISCGAFLLRDDQRFHLIRLHADYLNSESRAALGIPDLVTRSVLTTRRFDALKLWLSFQMIGRETFAAMVERLVDLAQAIAATIDQHPDFDLLHQPQFGCVVFRYRPANGDSHRVNEMIPLQMFEEGVAVLGHTIVKGEAALKLTINNPCISAGNLQALLDDIARYGKRLA